MHKLKITGNKKNTNKDLAYYFKTLTKRDYQQQHISMNREEISNSVLCGKELLRYCAKPNLKILDIGAGFCDLEKKILRSTNFANIIEITALDQSTNMLRQCRRDLCHFQVKINFLGTDALKSRLPTDYSNITFLINVLPYLPKWEKVIHELYRITANGGIIVIVVPIQNKLKFWKTDFGGGKICLNENIEPFFTKAEFKLIEKKLIHITPIPQIRIIKIPIAKKLIYKVTK